MKTLLTIATGLLMTLPVIAQSRSQLKNELRTQESAAKEDPDALMTVAEWAKENDLTKDFERILKNILRLDPTHEGANLALGNVKFDGKWMPGKKAAELRKKAQEAEFKSRGMVKIEGAWVEKDHVDDAKRGVFHHAGDRVSLVEMLALQDGAVRHPVTGELIDGVDAEKAETMFPISEGRWADEEKANRWHSRPDTPWVYRTHHATVLSTMKLEKVKELARKVDEAYELIQPLLRAEPSPARRPVVMVAATPDEYRQWGNDIGDEGSTYGAFLATQPMNVRGLGDVVPGVSVWDENWGFYNARHACGLAFLNAVCQDIEAEVPLWFLRAFGSYPSLFENGYTAGWFGEQHIGKGGVKNVKSWLSSFSINGEMETRDIEYNVFQAGLMVSFATAGGDDKATDAMLKISETFEKGRGKGVDKAIAGLEKVLMAREDEIKAYLQKLVQEKNK